ncbi:hypothetical protein R3W88_016163 [Solanum pinnatisectum]|uniref:DNA-directed RNA polymerase subunit n=1 Tax=Solanum pinnatisectum TaxID=50273 RepID=A0AAV9KZ01_9SOLN|nr:hypothetical protein R3W88_016163 [Solanum pinnatisectum]
MYLKSQLLKACCFIRQLLFASWMTLLPRRPQKYLGYFMNLTTLERIGEGKVREHTGDVLFPEEFSCVTFKIFRGEILEGVVDKILKHSVFLRCGPTDKYVPGENPIFMNEKMSRIEKDTVMCFIVVGARYVEAEKEFQAVVSLGPG